jgi:hypothetical protein
LRKFFQNTFDYSIKFNLKRKLNELKQPQNIEELINNFRDLIFNLNRPSIEESDEQIYDRAFKTFIDFINLKSLDSFKTSKFI